MSGLGTILLLIIVLCLVMAYLVLLANKNLLITQLGSKSKSIVNAASGEKLDYKTKFKFLAEIGQSLESIFTHKDLEKLKSKCFHIGREQADFHTSLALAFFSLCGFLIMYVVTNNIFSIILAALSPVAILSEIEFAYSAYIQSLEKSIVHLVECVKVLMVKSETSLTNALKIIADGLPETMQAARKELNKIYNLSQKKGLKNTLLEFETELDNYQDLISLLIAINEGTSKSALSHHVEHFLSRAREQEAENKKIENENLQFYLLFPVIVMFVVIMFPFVDSINYMMSNSGLL